MPGERPSDGAAIGMHRGEGTLAGVGTPEPPSVGGTR